MSRDVGIVHNAKYPHLHLREWPFNVVPERRGDMVWAGRPDLRRKVDRLLRTLGRRPETSLHLMWADFGAGKTHTLYYIASQASVHGLYPVYVEWPKRTTTFLDVYRSIAGHFTRRTISRTFWLACERVGVDTILDRAAEAYPDFLRVLEKIYEESDDPLLLDWLRAEPGLTKKDLTTIGVRNPIRTSDDAIKALVVLTGLISSSGEYGKLLLLLDEFQRIDQLPPKVRRDVNVGLHTLYNACPEGLGIILSFSFGRAENIRFLVSEEVLSRVDLDNLQLPQMNKGEGFEFLRDLLNQYRDRDDESSLFPFTTASVETVLDKIDRLTPRQIMKYFDVVLRRAEMEIEEGCLAIVTPDYAAKVLAETVVTDDED